MKKIILTLVPFLLFSCHTIHFDNVANPNYSNNKINKWHHNIILDLIEMSDPVDLKKECHGQQWKSVKTERTFLNGLATSVANVFIGPLWYPKTVEISCHNK